jgi:dTDP-4-dehydrorhamnose reductase
MRVFVTGNKGQLGRALELALHGHTLSGCDLPEVDVTDRAAVAEAIRRFAPEVVIHAAAWTDVDGCARDPERAFRANAIGTQNVALACASAGAALAYVSTNEVFDGTATEPYREWDETHPVNPYGRSKAAGEWFVSHLLDRFYIARTAWLYAASGRNFPHRIIQIADERGSLDVVTDEVGNPTYAPDLAGALSALIQTEAFGIYHLVNSGHCSCHDFAREILRLAGRERAEVRPITVDVFSRDSTPPRFAPLRNTAGALVGVRLRPWQEALAEFLASS